MFNLQGTLWFVSPSRPLRTPPHPGFTVFCEEQRPFLPQLTPYLLFPVWGGWERFRVLSIGPRWWGDRVKAGYGQRGQNGLHLKAGASLRARSSSTRHSTTRQQASGWSRQEGSATRRSMAQTSPAAARPFLLLLTDGELRPVLEKVPFPIIQSPRSSWDADLSTLVPPTFLGGILSRFWAPFLNQAEKATKEPDSTAAPSFYTERTPGRGKCL